MENERIVLGLGFVNDLKVGQEPGKDLVRYLRLISEAESVEEACVLILGLPHLAGTRICSNDFHNSFYCLAEMIRSAYQDVALCAVWAAIGSGYYDHYSKISFSSAPSYNFDEFFCTVPNPPEEELLKKAIGMILVFLGKYGWAIDTYPRFPAREVNGKPYRFLQRLVPENKYNEAAQRFLKANYDHPDAARALLKFERFEDLVRGFHYGIVPELEKYILEHMAGCQTIEDVESMGSFSGSKGHACSAWRRLVARQKAIARAEKGLAPK